ncbi:MAG: amidohydrolase [Candidatus Micrarchaeota archaeon]|nr:amidohydrolase [Candidatus Micrarchaeota archaeon]
MSLLIRGATLLPGKKADVLIEGNKISKIAPSISAPAEERLNAQGKLLLPGLINSHTHAAMSILRGSAEDMELESWLASVWKLEKRLSEESVYAGTQLACLEMIKGGTTCFSDMYFHMDAMARAVEGAGIRAVLGYSMIDGGNKKGSLKSANEEKMEEELKIAEDFIKKWHGKGGGRITCSVAPHAIYTCSAELLKRAHRLSLKCQAIFHIHLSETRKEVLDCLKENKKRPAHYLEWLGVLSGKTLAAHCVWLSKEEVRALSRHGASPALCPVSNMKLAGGGAAPFPEMLEAGMNVSLGTDSAVSNNSLSMFETMKFASLLQKNSRWDAAAVKAEDAFTAATLGGAKALSLNAGEVKEGRLADLILVDLKSPNMQPICNLLPNVVYSAHCGNVSDAIIDGKIVMESRKVLTLDEEKVIERAQNAAASIFS